MAIVRRFLLPCLVLALSGCAGSQCGCPRPSDREDVSAAEDPADSVLTDSMQTLVEEAGLPTSSRFQYVRTDLDADGLRDALVLMNAPYGTWCDLYGCTLYVMKARADGFDYISQIRPVRTPLLISDTRTQGWRDLVLRIDGRWSQTHDVALRFDGAAYPSAPEAQPPLSEHAVAALGGQKVFP